MKQFITIVFLVLGIARGAHAFEFDRSANNAQNLQIQAKELLAAGRKEDARLLLERAWAEAGKVNNKNNRIDAMAAVAADVAGAGWKEASRPEFAQALALAQDIGNSGVAFQKTMVVMAAQKKAGDADGVRESGLSAIRSGMLENMARWNVHGVGDFVSALDGALTPQDTMGLMNRVAAIKSAALRRDVLEGLSKIQLKPGDAPDAAALTALESGAPAGARDLEQVIWMIETARLYRAAGNEEKATHLLNTASVTMHGMPTAQQKADALIDQARKH